MLVLVNEMRSLDIAPSRVLRLHRSMQRLEVAIPGYLPQKASAFVCAYIGEKGGARVAAVLHLKETDELVFYLNNDGDAPQSEAGRLLNEGITFVESMGFLTADAEYHLVSAEKKEKLWAGVPLRHGIAPHPVDPVVSPEEGAETPLLTPLSVEAPSAERLTDEETPATDVESIEEELSDIVEEEPDAEPPPAAPLPEEMTPSEDALPTSAVEPAPQEILPETIAAEIDSVEFELPLIAAAAEPSVDASSGEVESPAAETVPPSLAERREAKRSVPAEAIPDPKIISRQPDGQDDSLERLGRLLASL